VRDAASAVTGVTSVDVHWLTSPTWSSDRITARARKALADRFTVAVGNDDEAATCPRCGESTVEQSTFGPSRCRAIHRCSGCAEVVEVLRA
jgi:metal-sulfur cluster biosynthetic enzyme